MYAEVNKTSKKQTPFNISQNMMPNNSNIQYEVFENQESQEPIDQNQEYLQLDEKNDDQLQFEQFKQDKQNDKQQHSSQVQSNILPLQLKTRIQNQDNIVSSESINSNDINQQNFEYYLQSDREHIQFLDSENGIRNKFGHKRGIFYNTPRSFNHNKMYEYDVPMKLKTDRSYDDNIPDTQISLDYAQSPANLTLGQLNSKSFFINSIMKKNSKELIEDQRKIAQVFASSTNIEQAAKQIEEFQKKQKYKSQLNLDLIKIQNGDLDQQSQDLKNKFQIQKIKQNKNEPNKIKSNKNSFNRTQKLIQPIEDSQQSFKIQPLGKQQKRIQSVLSSFTPGQEPISIKARSGSTVKSFQPRSIQTLSSHVSPSNDTIKQGEKIFNFSNKSSTQQQGGQNRLPDLNNKSLQQQLLQNANKKSKSHQQLNNILMHTQQAQPQVFNQLQQQQSSNSQRQGSYNQMGMLNSLSQRITNQQNYILIGKKNQTFKQGYSTSTQFKTSSNDQMFSSTSNSYRDRSKRKNMLNNFINNRDTDENDTDDFVEESDVESNNKLIKKDLYGQKYVMKIDGVLQPSDYDSKNKQKINQISTNQDKKPGDGILTQVLKPVESLSYYYQNKNPNQADLVIERTNLNALLNPLLQQNSFESKWKIERSDIVDMEASRMASSTSSLSPNKVLNRKLSSQQLSPNSFFPQPSIKHSNENAPLINQNDNINISVSPETNVRQQYHPQKSSSGDSQQQNIQPQNQIQINSSKEINTISNDNKLLNDTSQISIIQRKQTGLSQKSISPVLYDQELKEINRSASSSISLQVSQLNIDNIKGDREVFENQRLLERNNISHESQAIQKQSNQAPIIKSKKSEKDILSQTSKQQTIQQTSEKQIGSQASQKSLSQQSSEQLNSSNSSSQQIISSISQKQIIPKQIQQQTKINLINFEKEDQKIQISQEQNMVSENKKPFNKKQKFKQTTLEYQLNCQSSSSSSSSKQNKNQNQNKSYDSFGDKIEQFQINIISQELKNKQPNISDSQNQQQKKESTIIVINDSSLLSIDQSLLQSQKTTNQNDNFMKLEEQFMKEMLTNTMTTVQEKSELTSIVSIPTHEGFEMNRKKNISSQVEQSPQSYMKKGNQKIQSLNEVSDKKLDSKTKIKVNEPNQINEEQQKLSKSLDQPTLNKVNSEEKIEHFKIKRQNSNKEVNDEKIQQVERSITKKRSISEQDRQSLKKINDQNPLNSAIPAINQQFGEKKPTAYHLSIDDNYQQTDQQLRTKRETFKGKQDDELQINVVPPDNSTPQSNRNIQTKFNFTELSQQVETQNSPTQRKKSLFGTKNTTNIQNNTNNDNNSNDINNNANNNDTFVQSNSLNNDNNNITSNSVNNNHNKNEVYQENRVSIIISQNNNLSSLSSVNTNTVISNTENLIHVQSHLQHGRSSSSSTFNQDDQSQSESKNTINSENNFIGLQKQQQSFERNKKHDKLKRQSQQQLYIQNHYQKLTRSVKSNEDTFNKYDNELNDKNKREDSHSNTTKNSAKKIQDLGNFQQEADNSLLSNERDKLPKKQSTELKIFDEVQQKHEKTSFDGTSNRRSSILTPQQIKQIKKESRFFGKTSIYNKKSDSDEPQLFNIYGQESESISEDLSGFCIFQQSTPIKQSLFKNEDDAMINRLLSENEPPTQLTQYQQHQINFQKLIQQIDNSKQNPYSESFEKPKGDSIFQKNVKTLFRKINQYFKAKYHFDSTNQTDFNRVASRTQIQENPNLKLQNKTQSSPLNSKTLISKGIGITASEKQIPPSNNKKSIQSDLAQSDEIEYEDKQLNDNHELKKSDIEKLHQKLLKRDKKNIIDKLIIKTDESTTNISYSKEPNNQYQGFDKQSTLDRISGILRNNKKKQSQKLVIQINPPSDEPQINLPQIKLDFSAIKKKNGNTEFVLDQNNIQETESLQSSNEDEDENDEDKNIDIFPNYLFQKEQKTESFKNFDFLNNSQDSWDGSINQNQNKGLEQKGNPKQSMVNELPQQRKQSEIQYKNQKIVNDDQNDSQHLQTTLHFLNNNSWRFVKSYQATYLEKQIDKGFMQKVQRLPDILKNLKNKVDPTDGYKLENLINPINNYMYGFDDFKSLNKDGNTKFQANYIQPIKDNKGKDFLDLSQINLYEHIFQRDQVNEYFLDEKKRQSEDHSSSDEQSDNSLESSIESIQDVDMDTYFVLSDYDKDLSDKNQFIYDEEDYDIARAQYLLKQGYLEPTTINEQSNMFTQLNEQIVPVLSGIDNEYINQILKSRGKNEKNVLSEQKEQSHIEKKFKMINKMISQLDLRSSQTDMKNIQSEYNDLLEGDFQDNLKIDHDFYKKDFIKLQQQQFNKFIISQKNQKRKQLTINGTKKIDSSGTINASINNLLPLYQNQPQKLQIRERSPKSNPDLFENATSKLKSQDTKQLQQYQNFQHSLTQYQQQQQNIQQQSSSLQQQQIQMQQQQQGYQQLQLTNQSYTLQQNPTNMQSFIQQNTLPSSSIQYNLIQPQNQQPPFQRSPANTDSGNTNSNAKNAPQKGFTQSLKNFNYNQNLMSNGNVTLQYIAGLPQKTEPNLRSQVTIKNDDDYNNAYKNIQKMNTPQSFKSDMQQTTTIQSNYNKTSTLQSQQSIFNQSDTLQNRDAMTMVSQEISKQGVKVSESQYMLQKTNTTHSVDENQLTAPSPTQISKKDIRSNGRKRSIFNTDNQIQNISSQQQSLHDQNRTHPSPPSLHSPNFPHHVQLQSNTLPQPHKQNQFKPINFFGSTPQNNATSPLLSQNQHQIALQQHQKVSMSFNPANSSGLVQPNLNSYYSSQLPQQQQYLTQQFSNPQQQQLQPAEIPLTPIRSPYRGSQNIQHGLFHGTSINQATQQLNNLNYTGNSVNMNGNIYNINNPGVNAGYISGNTLYQQLSGNQGYQTSNQQNQTLNIYPSTPSNLNLQSLQLKTNPSYLQLDNKQTKQMRSNRAFSSLTATRELEKSTSMERQNLVMRTRLQQNQRRGQLDQKDQVFSAIKEDNIHEIEELLNQFHSLSLESKDEEGNTFILVAAQVGSREIVEYLFQKGADINASNNEGDTALHKANFYQYHGVADFLIQNRAQQNKLNNNGMNPWGCYPQQSKR